MADFDKPTVDSTYVEQFEDIRKNMDAVAVMFNGVSASNIPINAIQYSGGVFGLWNGSSFSPVPVSVSGGGTGAVTASEARLNLGILSQVESNAVYMQQSANLSDLTNKGTARTELDVYSKAESNAIVPAASTSVQGKVQLNNTLTSTSTSQALTAAQGKALNDLISALPSYQEATLGASGGLTSGSCKVARVGSIVTISGLYTHSSSTGPQSANGFIPSWAWPSGINSQNNYAVALSTIESKQVSVGGGGQLSFLYVNSSGSSSADTQTGNFTISYTV